MAEATARQPRRRRAILVENGPFRNLWSAQLISMFGDGLYNVALPWFVYVQTHSGAKTALTVAVATLPYLLFGIIAGVYVDRWGRKRTLVCSDLARAAVLALLPLLLLRGFNFPVVLAVAFLLPVFGRFFVPAQRATTPLLVHDDGLVAANALMEGAGNTAYIAGPVIAGALLAVTGAVPLLFADGATFLASAFFISRIRFSRQAAPVTLTASVRAELMEGLRTVWHTPQLRTLCSIAPFATAGFAVVPALLPVWVQRSAHAGAGAYGVLTAAFFVGALLGSLALTRYGARIGQRWMVLGGILALTLSIGAFSQSHTVAAGILALAVMGTGVSAFNVGALTMLQRGSPAGAQGRVFAFNESASQCLRPLAVVGAGIVADAAGINPTLLAIAGGLLAVWVVGLCARSLYDNTPTRSRGSGPRAATPAASGVRS